MKHRRHDLFLEPSLLFSLCSFLEDGVAFLCFLQKPLVQFLLSRGVGVSLLLIDFVHEDFGAIRDPEKSEALFVIVKQYRRGARVRSVV